MLYVFQVDTGVMMTFEMRLVMENVGNLKKAIATKSDIAEDKQVLLVSGGECLSNSQRVCSYSSAGTETSPIFLFAKINIESNQTPLQNISYDDDTNITEMIESCMSMQPSLDTLLARTELAVDLNEKAMQQRDVCERLVHDQHLQQQGWAAVTANLDDLIRAFKNKAEMLMAAFVEFIKCKPTHLELLNKFNEGIKHLDDIPILPTLLGSNRLMDLTRYVSFSESSNESKTSPKDTSVNRSKSNRERRLSRPSKKDEKSLEQSSNMGSSETDKACSQFESASSSSKNPSTASQMSLDETNNDSVKRLSSSDACSKPSELDKDDKHNDEESMISRTKPISDLDQKDDEQSKSCSNIQSNRLPLNLSEETSITLKQWIDFHDNHNSLDRLIELCWRGLDRFTENNADQIRFEVQDLLKAANNTSMKEIKGLEERLFGLEKLMVDAKKVVDEQCQLASSFQNNRKSFSKIKDSTLLPDLSTSHKQQLQMMLTNHQKMNDYRNRCIKAKHELSINLYQRLKWIMYIEQQICDLDAKLMIYRENLQRLNRHFEIVSQVQKSPELYLASVVESLRRRRFTRRYLHWANSIAKVSQELYNNEMKIRAEFDTKLGNHFLSSLFPGLTKSYPPPFATVQPDPFDTKLPRITASDIQYLQANLSGELAQKLYIPKDVFMPHIISAPTTYDSPQEDADDLEDRHSLNPTPPSSPARQPQETD